MTGLLALLAVVAALAGEPTAGAGPGKPGAPLVIEAVSVERPQAAGRFTAEVRVMALADHEELALTARGAPGIRLEAGAGRLMGPGTAGRTATWIVSGEWSGDGLPRVYLQAESRVHGVSAGRWLTISVAETEVLPPTAGRLDSANGALVFEVE